MNLLILHIYYQKIILILQNIQQISQKKPDIATVEDYIDVVIIEAKFHRDNTDMSLAKQYLGFNDAFYR